MTSEQRGALSNVVGWAKIRDSAILGLDRAIVGALDQGLSARTIARAARTTHTTVYRRADAWRDGKPMEARWPTSK